MKGDTPIALITIDEMDDAQFYSHLEAIRERRMKPVRDYEALQLLKEQARKEGMQKKYEQQMSIFERELTRLDNTMKKVEERWRKLRELRLEIDS